MLPMVQWLRVLEAQREPRSVPPGCHQSRRFGGLSVSRNRERQAHSGPLEMWRNPIFSRDFLVCTRSFVGGRNGVLRRVCRSGWSWYGEGANRRDRRASGSPPPSVWLRRRLATSLLHFPTSRNGTLLMPIDGRSGLVRRGRSAVEEIARVRVFAGGTLPYRPREGDGGADSTGEIHDGEEVAEGAQVARELRL